MLGVLVELRVDLAEVAKTADDVHHARAELADEWEKVRARAKALFESGWTGTAADSYTEPWQECEDGYRRVLASLESMARSLHEAAEMYQAQESRNSSSITSAGGLNLDV